MRKKINVTRILWRSIAQQKKKKKNRVTYKIYVVINIEYKVVHRKIKLHTLKY